jgi:hypothetical protein
VRKAWDQLDDAIRATFQGLAFSARAVAAPSSMHLLGEGPGGSKAMSTPLICRVWGRHGFE